MNGVRRLALPPGPSHRTQVVRYSIPNCVQLPPLCSRRWFYGKAKGQTFTLAALPPRKDRRRGGRRGVRPPGNCPAAIEQAERQKNAKRLPRRGVAERPLDAAPSNGNRNKIMPGEGRQRDAQGRFV